MFFGDNTFLAISSYSRIGKYSVDYTDFFDYIEYGNCGVRIFKYGTFDLLLR